MRALEMAGLEPSDVEWLMLTHIHLDHAGGAGRLISLCPNAQLLVHPRGVRHMSDPARLEQGVRAVYGDDVYDEQYGALMPVEPGRIVAAEEGLAVDLDGRTLVVMDTPGHARHHVCFLDEKSCSMFTGDTMGVAYPELRVKGHPFLFPPTSPVDFDPDAWHVSVEMLGISPVDKFYLTHFGSVSNSDKLIDTMHRRIDDFARLALETPAEQLDFRLNAYLLNAVREHGCTLPEEDIQSLLALDIDLCAQGLTVWRNRSHPEN